MINHVHVYAKFPSGLAPSQALRGVKRTTSYQLLRWFEENDPEVYKHLHSREGDRVIRRFYQAGAGYDKQTPGDPNTIREIISYIHNNPVRAGIVQRAEQWQWSSAPDWTGTGKGMVTLTSPYDLNS